MRSTLLAALLTCGSLVAAASARGADEIVYYNDVCATADWRGDSPRRRPLDCQLTAGVCTSR